MITITALDRTRFNQDGFLIVDQLIQSERIPLLHQAFDDLFNGDFETGVRPLGTRGAVPRTPDIQLAWWIGLGNNE